MDICNYSVEDITANGPYRVADFVSGEYLLLEKNNFYLEESPEIDKIRILFDSDFNKLVEMLNNGEIDLLNFNFDLELMRRLDENEDLNLWVKPGNMLEHIAICLKQAEG